MDQFLIEITEMFGVHPTSAPWRRAAPSAHQRHIAAGSAAHAMNRLEALFQALITGLRRVQAENQNVLGVEAEIDGMKVGDGRNEETGGHHHGQQRSTMGLSF